MVEIKSIGVIRCGTVFAVLYGFFGLIEALFMVPIMVLAPSGGPNAFPPALKSILGVGGFIFLPIFCAIAGFIGGMITALIYNLVAGWTGGLEVRVEQVPGGTELRPLSS